MRSSRCAVDGENETRELPARRSKNSRPVDATECNIERTSGLADISYKQKGDENTITLYNLEQNMISLSRDGR
jgi:hypothetical protein